MIARSNLEDEFRVPDEHLFFASLAEVKTANEFKIKIGKNLKIELYRSVYFFLQENVEIRTMTGIIAVELT